MNVTKRPTIVTKCVKIPMGHTLAPVTKAIYSEKMAQHVQVGDNWSAQKQNTIGSKFTNNYLLKT